MICIPLGLVQLLHFLVSFSVIATNLQLVSIVLILDKF